MSHVEATFRATERAFHVEGHERIDFSLLYVDGVFAIHNSEISDVYRQYGRCLMVVDATVYGLYREAIEGYFAHHQIDLTTVPIVIKEPAIKNP